MKRLQEKVAIITGGGAGIGRGICLALAREGAKVAVVDKDERSARETCRQMQGITNNYLAINADVRIETDVKHLVATTVKQFGQVDILCANAGVHAMNRVVDITEEEWDTMMDVNAKGVFLCCKHAAQQMIKQGHGGKIINVSSQSGKTGYALESHYSASKFAVIGFTMALADELAIYKINVNAVCPGIIDTALQENLVKREAIIRGTSVQALERRLTESTPLGRFGRPDDVAKLVVFLASDESEFMTGQAINITGGMEKH